MVDWFIEAEKHLDDPMMRDYVGTRWGYLITVLADAQGVPAGWLAYSISSLVVEAAAHGQQA